MEILLVILITALLVYLLHRDNRSNPDADPYRDRIHDRDAERVRADLLAGADALGRRPLRRAESAASHWEPRA